MKNPIETIYGEYWRGESTLGKTKKEWFAGLTLAQYSAVSTPPYELTDEQYDLLNTGFSTDSEIDPVPAILRTLWVNKLVDYETKQARKWLEILELNSNLMKSRRPDISNLEDILEFVPPNWGLSFYAITTAEFSNPNEIARIFALTNQFTTCIRRPDGYGPEIEEAIYFESDRLHIPKMPIEGSLITVYREDGNHFAAAFIGGTIAPFQRDLRRNMCIPDLIVFPIF